MSKHSDYAKELFNKGYNCSQSVFAAFCDKTGLGFEDALKISASFGGGMGGGAVDIFNERNVEVVAGASGDAKTAVHSILYSEILAVTVRRFQLLPCAAQLFA